MIPKNTSATNFNTTYVLFAMLMLLVAFFALGQLYSTKTKDDPSLWKEKLDEKDIARVEIDHAGAPAKKLVFVRDGEDWKLEEPYKTRVDSFMVRNLVSNLLRLRKDANPITASPADLGLEPAKAVVTLSKSDGTAYKLNVGSQSIGSADNKTVFVASSDRPTEPASARFRDLEDIHKTAKDFRAKYLALESNLSAVGIDLKDAKHELYLVKVEDAARPDSWRFKVPAYGDAEFHGEGTGTLPPSGAPHRIAGVRDLLVAVDQLKVAYNAEQKQDDFVAENVKPEELAKTYGLDAKQPETLRIEASTRAGSNLGADKAKPEIKSVLLIGKQTEDKEKFFARMENENNVVRVPAKSVDQLVALLGNMNTLRNRDLVQVDTSKTDAIDIKNAAGVIKLRKIGEPAKWKLFDDGKPRDADQNAVNGLLNVLTTPRQVKDFPSEPDDKLGLDDKSATGEVKLWVDGIKDKKDEKGEPNLGQPTATLVLGGKKDDVIYIKRILGSDTTRLAVPAGLPTHIGENKLAYLDKTLPQFKKDDEVVKLTLRTPDGQTVVELEKAKKEDKTGTWTIKEPKEQEGRKADAGKIDVLIDTLRTLQADRLISEKATDKELNDDGLEPALFQATVTLRQGDKTEDRVFRFGKETDKKDGRYAKLGERDLVFLVRPEIVNVVRGKDLAELKVFNFELAKAKGIKLIGLASAKDKKPATLELEFKEPKAGASKSWVVKNDKELAGFQFDPLKMNVFVAGLSRLGGERFLVFKAGPKPEHKLDAKSGPLRIEITLDGEEKPLTLTIGGPVTSGEQKGYAAQSSTLPGDVFLLPEERFEKLLKEGLKFFEKDIPAK